MLDEAVLAGRAPGDAHAVLDVDGRVLFVTSAVEKVLGYTPEEYMAHEPIDLIHEDDRAEVRERWRELLHLPGARQVWQVRARHRDGDYRWLELVMVNGLADPELAGFLSSFSDISERVGLSPTPATESRFENLLRSSPDVIASLDLEGRIVWISSVVEEMLGYQPHDLIGQSAFDFVHPEDYRQAIDRFGAAIVDIDQVDPVTVRVAHANGSWQSLEIAGAPVVGRDGEVTDLTINLRDVRWRQGALDALRASERLFRSLAQSSPMGIYQRDVAGSCTYVNDRWCEITGMAADEALGFGWRAIIHPEDLEKFYPPRSLDRIVPSAEPVEFRVRRPDGDLRWVSLRTSFLYNDEGEPSGAIGALEDITEQRRSQRATQRLTEIFEATADLVSISDPTGKVLYLNAAAKRYFDVGDGDELEFADAFPPSVLERLAVEILPVVERQGVWSGELSLSRPGGGVMPASAQVLRHVDPESDDIYYSTMVHDLSERKAFERRLAHQATHDPLTGLPNRLLLIDRLEGALARARRHRSRVAVLFLDLDHFKVVNDSLGHGLGDRLLLAISERLSSALRPGDTVARFGGDEFVVLCEDVASSEDAITVAERIDAAISGRFMIDETEVFVGVSIGIACPDEVDVDPETLIRDADAAMYRAKDRGRARWELFDNQMRASAVDRLDIENALRRALDHRELRIFYQPIIDVASGLIDGVEALLRWEHPARGLLNPDEFITVAEETGLIVPIGAWVLDQATRQVQRWHASVPGHDRLRLAVNLSGRQLGHPRLVEDVATVLADTGIDPGLLELEITESVLMDDVDASEDTLGRLHQLGVKLAVDDFGTGYSSLSYLQRFPVDLLKVDRSFVDGLGAENNDGAGDSAIVTAIVTLAHTLGLNAAAEGVEAPEQLAVLRQLGCDRAQGFYIARPVNNHDLGEQLTGQPRW